ncbi:MAG: hypothetical protein GYA20_07325 [Chloroflexi bacterium]|nr:hypothetical protein [Chloroflexota bacterium]
MPGKSRAMMFVNSDFSDLLNLFNTNQVKYLIIGGYAVVQYAEPRYTKDLDIWISLDQENAAAVYKSLKRSFDRYEHGRFFGGRFFLSIGLPTGAGGYFHGDPRAEIRTSLGTARRG